MTYYIQPYPFHRMARRWLASTAACTPDFDHTLSVNIRDEDDAYTLTALVPGLKADDLNIQVIEDVVTIEGEYKQDETEYLMQELPSGTFKRALRLPTPVDEEKVEAKIVDGFLTLRLPKAESARPKKIKINTK